MNTYYNNGYDVAAFFICVFAFIYFFQAQHIRKQQHSLYLLLLICLPLTCMGNILAGGIAARSTGKAYEVLRANLFIAFYFAANSLIFPLFTLYIQGLNGILFNKKRSYYFKYLIPYFFGLILIILNFRYRFMFYYDDNCIYHRGKYMYLLYFGGAWYVLVALISFAVNRAYMPKRKVKYLFLSMFYSIVGFLVQLMFKEYQVQLFGESLTALALLITCENEEQEVDTDTRLYNYNTFIDDFNTAKTKGDRYSIITVVLANSEHAMPDLSQWEYGTLLRSIAWELNETGAGVRVYRYGSEKFVLMPEESTVFDRATRTDRIIERITDRFSREWKVGDKSVIINVVITVARMPGEIEGLTIKDLFYKGNLNFSKSNIIVRRSEDLESLRNRAEIRDAVRRGCNSGAFKVYYQPIWSKKKGKVVSAEALVRLSDPILGMIYPDDFIDVAEESGLINELGKIVFENVCRFYSEKRPDRHGLKWIEINVSPYQLCDRDLTDTFLKLLREYNVPVSFINLELTETADSMSDGRMNETLKELRDLGFSFSMDDYGTGYSNLSSLVSGNYKLVKVDKSILWNADNKEGDDLLIKVMEILNSMNIETLQEGVETKEQLDKVTGLGCDLIQGYYFSKPVPEEEFVEYIKNQI
ncbi:MAG: EAL domain-containing protein [Lachnospiraceae bacterium]|nr:EAL domain-containing protein [Lachnospiraceae bacterium]